MFFFLSKTLFASKLPVIANGIMLLLSPSLTFQDLFILSVITEDIWTYLDCNWWKVRDCQVGIYAERKMFFFFCLNQVFQLRTDCESFSNQHRSIDKVFVLWLLQWFYLNFFIAISFYHFILIGISFLFAELTIIYQHVCFFPERIFKKWFHCSQHMALY